MDKLGFISEINAHNWDEMVKKYGIKYGDVLTTNKKYRIFVGEKNGRKQYECSCYTISNGNAFDCPSLKQGRCNVPCYGLKGCYKWDAPKINKEFQRKVLEFAPLSWLFDAIKHLATNKRMKKANRLTEVRLNEVSDLTQKLLDKTVALCMLLAHNQKTSHIKVFTYTKMANLDFTMASRMPNLCINTSQAINPIYENGNIYFAVDEATYDNIVENDIVKKCNCDIACKKCGYCYEDNGFFIYAKIH